MPWWVQAACTAVNEAGTFPVASLTITIPFCNIEEPTVVMFVSRSTLKFAETPPDVKLSLPVVLLQARALLCFTTGGAEWEEAVEALALLGKKMRVLCKVEVNDRLRCAAEVVKALVKQ